MRPTAGGFSPTVDRGMGFIVEAAMRSRTAPRALLVALLAVSACTPAASESPDPTGTDSTTIPTGPEAAGAPDSVPTTAPTTTTTTLPPLDPPTFESLAGINTILDFAGGYTSQGMALWERSVPDVEDVVITSSADGAEQPALWVAPRGDRDRPLIVVLHSWSAPYRQHAGIPFAMWAQENGWAVIAPHFRGVNNHPDAIGSDLAVQDVIDAIDFAVSQDGVDPDRVYAVGFSGGGMMSLLLAGRHPDRVTAVAAWTPVHDLVEFYRQARAAGRSYAGHILRGCGGDPTSSGPAQEECVRRSPMTYLDAARENGVPVFIGQGIADWLLSPSHAVNAFNQLADPEDRLAAEDVEAIGRRRMPDHLSGSITTDTYFGEGDPAPVFARRSGKVWLILFEAGHEMAYAPALRWFAGDPR
jgi:poly(3-hydroxybutyrate) depolymerase